MIVKPSLHFDFSEVIPIIQRYGDEISQIADRADNTIKAMSQSAELIRAGWIDQVRVKTPMNASWYAPNIMISPVMTDKTGTETEVFVPAPFDKRAAQLEEGHGPIDMRKEMLGTSKKVRFSKNGYRYLIIPFEHSVKSLEAAGVYDEAVKLSGSRITGARMEGVQQGATGYQDAMSRKNAPSFYGYNNNTTVGQVRRFTYTWGGRLEDTGQRNLEGMYRFDHTKTKVQNSTYITFRTMSENPKQAGKWIKKSRDGMFILKNVLEEKTPLVNQMISNAIKMDIANLQEFLKTHAN